MSLVDEHEWDDWDPTKVVEGGHFGMCEPDEYGMCIHCGDSIY